MAREQRPALGAAAVPPVPAPGSEPVKLAGWVMALTMLAGEGRKDAERALRESVRTAPHVWEAMVSPLAEGDGSWRRIVAGDGAGALHEACAIAYRADRLREDLLAGSVDPVEKLMVERIVAARLAVLHAERQLEAQVERGAPAAAWQVWATELERADRMLARAVESRERVRRLRGPRLEISVGTVNVAAAIGTGAAGSGIGAGTVPALGEGEE